MSGLQQASEAFTSANFRSPKTILGFFAILMGILATGTTVVVGICARVSELHNLIVPILSFTAVLFVGVLVGVFITAWRDPTILMLGQVSGEMFIENRRLTLGDSTAGEYTQEPIAVLAAAPIGGVLPSDEGVEDAQ